MHAAILVATMSVTTVLLRALPFFVFRKKTPAYVAYLGEVLPPAIIGMMVIYCLKDISVSISPFGIPELIAVLCVVGVQILRRNSLISILSGTVVYMVLVQMIF